MTPIVLTYDGLCTRFGALAIRSNLFVVFYEEPSLRRQFGESYEKYSYRVGRRIPRSRAS